MKKTYQAPCIQCVILKGRAVMQSVSGLEGHGGYGGNSTGRSADSRRGSFWDDEEYD